MLYYVKPLLPREHNPRRIQKAPGNAPKDQFPLDGIRESPSLPHPAATSRAPAHTTSSATTTQSPAPTAQLAWEEMLVIA